MQLLQNFYASARIGEFYAHQNFVRARDGRLWKFDEFEDFERWAEIPHLDRMHCRNLLTHVLTRPSVRDE